MAGAAVTEEAEVVPYKRVCTVRTTATYSAIVLGLGALGAAIGLAAAKFLATSDAWNGFFNDNWCKEAKDTFHDCSMPICDVMKGDDTEAWMVCPLDPEHPNFCAPSACLRIAADITDKITGLINRAEGKGAGVGASVILSVAILVFLYTVLCSKSKKSVTTSTPSDESDSKSETASPRTASTFEDNALSAPLLAEGCAGRSA